jgi:uncharacterized protein YbjT (DUF2867 family)
MVLVYGAAGQLGQEICRRLREKGIRVRTILSHDPSPNSSEVLKRLDVDVVVADLSQPAAVASACRGQQAVICADPAMTPSRNGPPLEAAGARCLVEFASAMGVKNFVFVTVPEHFATPCALVNTRHECYVRLEAHSMDYLVLETGFFMESWLTPEMGFDYKDGKAIVYGEGTQQVPWVSCDDVAELAVRALDAKHRRAHRLRVAAQGHMSPFELIRLFEDLRGGQIEVTRIPEAELRAEHKRTSDPGDKVRVAMKVEYAHGLPMRVDADEIPFTLVTVRDYARRITGQGATTRRTA